MKKCNRCGIEKKFIEFSKDKYNKDKFAKVCKSCDSERGREYRINNSKVGGFIYGITNPSWEGWVKVGRAKDTINRLNSYQTCSPLRDYEIKFSIKVKNLYLVEQFVYNKYECKSEWIFEDWKKIEEDILNLISLLEINY